MARFSKVSSSNKEKLLEVFTQKKKFDVSDISIYTDRQKESLMSASSLKELKEILGLEKVEKTKTSVAKDFPINSPVSLSTEEIDTIGWNELKNLTDLIKDEKPAIKLEIMKNFELSDKAKELLQMTYSPLVTYGITPEIVKKRMKGFGVSTWSSPTEKIKLLKDLSERKITGERAIENCVREATNDPFFLLLLGKDLEVRIGVSTINKVFPGLIPVYPVQLIQSTWIPGMKVPVKAPRWMIDRKLDGERGTIIIDKGEVTFKNRTGVEVDSLKYFCSEIKKVLIEKEKSISLPSLLNGIVLDGEIVKMVDGVETFQGLEREIRKVGHQMMDVKFIAFDLISTEVFFEGKVSEPLFSRRQKLSELLQILDVPRLIEEAVILWTGDNFPEDKIVQKNIDKIVGIGGEGVVLKADIPYKGVRHSGLIRCKPVVCEDFKCIGIKKSLQMIPGSTTKKSVLSAITVELEDGNLVDVGSGFSWKQREDFLENPETIIGFPIEVQYSIRTKNLEGSTSLRFPVFRKVHTKWEDKN